MANNIVSRITSAGTYFTGLPTKIPDNVVTNGLILYLNANNPASYPGTGNTWYDLSGQCAHGTINGNVSFVSAGTQSYFNFAIASDLNYIGSTASQDYQDVTILFQPDYGYISGLVGLISTGNAASSLDRSLRFNAGQIPWNLADTGNNNDWANGSLPASGTGVVNYYNNNTLYTSTFNIPAGWNVLGGAKNSSSASWPTNWSYFLGSGGYPGGRGFQGKIAAVLMYNRTLTAAEQRQNANALLDRFNFASNSAQFDEVSYNPSSGGAIAYSTTTKSSNPNLLISSSDYSNPSNWPKNNCSTTFTTATTAPDGTYTAQKFIEDSTTAEHWFSQYRSVFTAGQTATFSFYAKAAERSQLNLRFIGAVNLVSVNINLITGVTSSVNTNPNGLGYSVTPAGNGWWRIAASGSADQSTLLGTLFLIQDSPYATNYTGNGTSGVYLWGQQLEYGLSASNYVATDSIGPINRANTQLHRYTSDWNNANWSHSYTGGNNSVTLTSATTAPDGSMTAYKFVANTGANPNITNSELLSQQNGYGQITQGFVYTQSLFFKPAEFNTLRIRNNADGTIFDFVAGTTPVQTGVVLRPLLQNVGNGWYRASWSFVAQSIGGGGGRSDNWSYRLANTGDGTSGIYIWGPQLQLGNTLSPFIATSTPNTAINLFNTRTDNSGDVLTINNFDEVTYVNTNKNLLINSQQFNLSPWGLVSSILTTNTIIAPNGSSTATKLQETAGSPTTFYGVAQNPSSFIPNQMYTLSVYAKAGERNALTLNVAGSSAYAQFNLVSGTVQYSSVGTPSIISVGNGWYRCSITFKTLNTGSNLLYHVIIINNSGSDQYAGTPGYGIYIWGAQLEYNTTTTSYAPNPNKNLFVSTENLTVSPWIINGANVISTTELDPNGNYTASKFAYNAIYPNIKQNSIPVTPNTNYTISISAKGTDVPGIAMVSGNNTFFPNDATQFTNFNFGTGQTFAGVFPNYIYATMIPENNGYYRCSATLLTDATQNAISIAFWQGGYGYGKAGNTMTLFGPQLELGNTATTYTANTINLLSSKTLNGGTIAVTNEFDEVTWNPPIVTANLTLHLDAANPASYNGGNTWYDTSGKGNHGTLNGNVAVSSSNYGSMTFDGTTSPTETSIKFNTATGNSVGMYQSDFTVEAWVNGANTGAATPSGFPNYQIFDLLGSTPTAGSSYGMGYMQGYLVVGFYASGHYAFQPNTNTWYQIVHTYNYTTKSSKIYSNGVLKDTITMGTDLNANAAVAPVAVGWGYWGGGPWQGSIPVVRVYNKELSQSEINQNYNALAYRYNL